MSFSLKDVFKICLKIAVFIKIFLCAYQFFNQKMFNVKLSTKFFVL